MLNNNTVSSTNYIPFINPASYIDNYTSFLPYNLITENLLFDVRYMRYRLYTWNILVKSYIISEISCITNYYKNGFITTVANCVAIFGDVSYIIPNKSLLNAWI